MRKLLFLLAILVLAVYSTGCDMDDPMLGVNPNAVDTSRVTSIGVISSAGLIRNGDTILVPSYAVVNLTDTATGPVNYDSTKWTFYDNGSIKYGKDVTHSLPGANGVYKVSKRSWGVTNVDSMVFYFRIGPVTGNMGEQIVQLSPAIFISQNGKYRHQVGFNTAYLTGDTLNPWYVMFSGGQPEAKPLSWNDVVVHNGRRYLRGYIETYDSTWHLAYGTGNTSGPPANWTYANVSTSQWFVGGNINLPVIMTKNGQWYTNGTVSYTIPGSSGDTGVRKVVRWESIGNNSYRIYFNQRCVNSDNHGPYVRYRLPNAGNSWFQVNATYQQSTGFAYIEISRSAFTGNGEIHVEFFSGTSPVEADYTGSTYAWWTQELEYHLRAFFPS